MSKLELKNIDKVYGNKFKAVDDFNLTVENKDFVVMLGPSGCGKSTTLRMIAGLEDITSGDLIMDGKRVNDVEPKDRNIAMVFQNYALYPHQTVRENMAYGLKVRNESKTEIEEKVNDAASILGLEELLDRKPGELSGGQRQRVALGRAIVRNADFFLMDEPLSNLDAKLRVAMRTEIIQLHKRLGTTTIYVTHDQIEAMTMATKIVILNKGVIQQIGTPEEIYEDPANIFVSQFIGSPATNIFPAEYKNDQVYLIGSDRPINLTAEHAELMHRNNVKHLMVGVRPEKIRIVSNSQNSLKVKVILTEYYGAERMAYFTINNNRYVIKADVSCQVKDGDEIYITFDDNDILYFNKETGNRIK